MKVIIPSPLRSYTDEKPAIDAHGNTLDALLRDMDTRYPGIRFRAIDEQDGVRPHIKIFVNRQQVRDLAFPLAENDEVILVAALSGG